jgi:hypothetical protein
MLASAVAITLLGLGCVILAVVAWLIWRSRAQALKQKAGQEAGKDMENLIYQSAYTLGPSASATTRSTRSIVDCREMAFVVTGKSVASVSVLAFRKEHILTCRFVSPQSVLGFRQQSLPHERMRSFQPPCRHAITRASQGACAAHVACVGVLIASDRAF